MIVSKKSYIKLRRFLKSISNRNFWGFLFFLFLSTIFWFMLTLSEEYEVEVSVPVKLKNVPSNVVITTPPPSEIKIRLRDRGTSLLKYQHTNMLGTVTLDFEDYSQSTGYVALSTSDITGNVVKRLEGNTHVVGFSADTIDYFYNFGAYHKVPIRINASVSADSLYIISDTTLSHRYAKVYASPRTLDTLRAVYTKPFKLERLTHKESFTAQISPMRGVKIVPEQITATFDVDQVTEKTVQVPVEHINFPADKTLKTFPGIVDVTFHVGMKHYRDITAENFAIVVSYDDVSKAIGNRLRLSLKGKPAKANHIRIIPSEVEFLIEDSSEE